MDLDAAKTKFDTLALDWTARKNEIDTEQDARLKIIDRMLIEVLSWERNDIRTEAQAGRGFVDYVLSTAGRGRLVVEAKRVAEPLINTNSPKSAWYKASGPGVKSAKNAMEQATRYCAEWAIQFSAITNGFQWIGFWAVRTDGQKPSDGLVIVFPSLLAIQSEFATFYDLFSREGVLGDRFQSHVHSAEVRREPSVVAAARVGDLDGTDSDREALRQIVRPKSLEGANANFVIAVNPLSWRAVSPSSPGWRKRSVSTFSDYVGIRGLMRVFGLVENVYRFPELVNPDDFDDSVLSVPMHLYSIGSSKANRWTGLLMREFFAKKEAKWDFGPDPDSTNIRNPKVIIRENGVRSVPTGFRETNRVYKDFGIVLRGANPRDPSGRTMFTVLAGRSALGTEAACFAVTDPSCVRKLIKKLVEEEVDLEQHAQAFLAFVSIESHGEEAGYKTMVDKFKVWTVTKCE